ncbi:MAG: spermidine synthase, partial [Acidimicrobiia bacterium]|nr:spermidine synthase [Acidimicrobiia bacterium]
MITQTAAAPTEARNRAMVAVFVAASFLGSGLLFLVQPMVARMLLPLAGGTPSLWNTSLVFFQLVLLAGYGFAHVSTRRFGMRLHPLLQIAVLAIPIIVLPVSVSDSWRLPGDQSPALWVLAVLALVVGLPFFALSTSSPTLQRWFSATDHPAAANPYFLYAAGNLGSVLALISYPIVVEPLLSIGAQAWLWAALYVLFVAASSVAAWLTRARRTATSVEVTQSPPIAPARRVRWLLWSFVPSALMLGVTRHIGTDVASVPLLWIAPLLLYLTTFIIAFGRVSHRRTALSAAVVRYGVIPLAVLFVVNSVSLVGQIAVHLTWFFFAALLAHSRLSEDRPAPDRLTEFYLWISVGGVLGGAFAALLAPVVFTSVLEYPIVIGLAVLLVGSGPARVSVPPRVAGGFVVLMLGLAWLAHAQRLHVLAIMLAAIGLTNGAITLRSAKSYAGAVAFALLVVLVVQPSGLLDQQRSFFGVYRVVEESTGTIQLASGTTNHGTQA